jgi:hypothetical protein
MSSIANSWISFQVSLFPGLCSCSSERLTERHFKLLDLFDILKIHKHVDTWQWMGRKRIDRCSIARAFVVKAAYNLPTTDLLIELLQTQPTLRKICGFETRRHIPSAATFSRAFAEFAKTDMGDRVLAGLVEEHVGSKVVMHESLDSSAIEVREKAVPKPEPVPVTGPRCKIGRLKKGEKRIPREPAPLVAQLPKDTRELISELPKGCGWGTKKNSKGRSESWQGYKLHISFADGMVPLRAITTSAWVNDSMVAIPLLRSVAEKVTVLYDLMDAGYSANAIRTASRELEHAPIIDPNPTHNTPPLDPAQLERYKQRTTAERGFGRLKDEFGACHVRVRTHPKVHMHLMFGLIVLFVDQVTKPLLG